MAKSDKLKYSDLNEVFKIVGIGFKTARIRQGHSNYEKFAVKFDLNRSQVWRYERGEDLKLSSLLKMLNALDISLEDFFKSVDEELRERNK